MKKYLILIFVALAAVFQSCDNLFCRNLIRCITI